MRATLQTQYKFEYFLFSDKMKFRLTIINLKPPWKWLLNVFFHNFCCWSYLFFRTATTNQKSDSHWFYLINTNCGRHFSQNSISATSFYLGKYYTGMLQQKFSISFFFTMNFMLCFLLWLCQHDSHTHTEGRRHNCLLRYRLL